MNKQIKNENITIRNIEVVSHTTFDVEFTIGAMNKTWTISCELDKEKKQIKIMERQLTESLRTALAVLSEDMDSIVECLDYEHVAELCGKYEELQKERRIKESLERWDKDPIHTIVKELKVLEKEGFHFEFWPKREDVTEFGNGVQLRVKMETGPNSSTDLVIYARSTYSGNRWSRHVTGTVWEVSKSYKTILRPKKVTSLVKKLRELREQEIAIINRETTSKLVERERITRILKDTKALGAERRVSSYWDSTSKRTRETESYVTKHLCLAPRSGELAGTYSVKVQGSFTVKELKVLEDTVGLILAKRKQDKKA